MFYRKLHQSSHGGSKKPKKNLWTSLIMNNYYCVNNSLSFGARLLQLLEV